MSEAIVRAVPSAPVSRQQVTPMDFSADQLKIIRDSFLNGASEKEAAVLLELAKVRRLNPITRQIHFVKRNQWDPDTRTSKEVWSAQVGIDGFRAIAERTGLYDGQDEPEFEYDTKGGIKLCRVKVYRKDWSRAAVGVAHFGEYAQTKKDGSLTKMWVEKPHIMIAKCAEALAFRKAFPEDTSGLYAPEEEIGSEREEKDVSPNPLVANVDVPQPKTKALAAKVAERMQPKLPIIDVPPEVSPELVSKVHEQMRAADPYGSHKPVSECTDEELKARETHLLAMAKSKKEATRADAEKKLELVQAEMLKRMANPDLFPDDSPF